jgi:hypothetical protein
MKIYVEKGVVFAQAETEKDVLTLLAMKEPKQERATYKKECGQCGKKFRGLKLHMTKAHMHGGFIDPSPFVITANSNHHGVA